MKEGKNTPKNTVLLDYIIGIQLEKIERRLKLQPLTSKDTELAMSNLVELMKIRDTYPNL